MIWFSIIAIIAIMAFIFRNFFVEADQIQTSEVATASIAVLPFDHHSSDQSDLYFTNGITDEIRSRLLSMPNLKVISRSSCEFSKKARIIIKGYFKNTGC